MLTCLPPCFPLPSVTLNLLHFLPRPELSRFVGSVYTEPEEFLESPTSPAPGSHPRLPPHPGHRPPDLLPHEGPLLQYEPPSITLAHVCDHLLSRPSFWSLLVHQSQGSSSFVCQPKFKTITATFMPVSAVSPPPFAPACPLEISRRHTFTSKKAEPKVGHLKMSFRNASLASSLDFPACLLKYATMDCGDSDQGENHHSRPYSCLTDPGRGQTVLPTTTVPTYPGQLPSDPPQPMQKSKCRSPRRPGRDKLMS